MATSNEGSEVDHWDIKTLDVEPRHPQVLLSEDQGRAIAINLPAGEELQEHEVHEHAWMWVADGEIEVVQEGGSVTGTAGYLAHFEPGERRLVRATADSRLLLLLTPWPGDGHPSTRGQA